MSLTGGSIHEVRWRKVTCPLGALAKLRKANITFAMSVSPYVCLLVRTSSWNNLAPTLQICVKIYISLFFKNLSRKLKFHYDLTIITDTLHEDLYAFMISHWITLTMKNISDIFCSENQTTYFCSKTFPENSAVFEIMWKNMVQTDRLQVTV